MKSAFAPVTFNVTVVKNSVKIDAPFVHRHNWENDVQTLRPHIERVVKSGAISRNVEREHVHFFQVCTKGNVKKLYTVKK